MLYGSLEFAYAEPFANSLVVDPLFRSWVVRQTKFADLADGIILLHEDMRALRDKSSASWWRSHYTEKCRCQGCGGQETDVLAVFEAISGFRFALHFEVKHPTDGFKSKKEQAANYAIRAACWTASPPKAVLRHSDASTVLLCSASKLSEYALHVPKFATVITFEEVVAAFPDATRPTLGALVQPVV